MQSVKSYLWDSSGGIGKQRTGTVNIKQINSLVVSGSTEAEELPSQIMVRPLGRDMVEIQQQ